MRGEIEMDEKDERAFKVACDALYAWGYSEQFSRSLWITALEYARNKQAEPVAWADLLHEAQSIVESKSVYKKFIKHTPLDNDIAVWVADFAESHTHPTPTVCATCNGHGMIGGPSYYRPDEGGEPCPDCNAPAVAVNEQLLESLLAYKHAFEFQEKWDHLESKQDDIVYNFEHAHEKMKTAIAAAEAAKGASHD